MEIAGTPESLLLDIVECARSHTGANLATTFKKVLEDFGISDKVRSKKNKKTYLTLEQGTGHHLQQCIQ